MKPASRGRRHLGERLQIAASIGVSGIGTSSRIRLSRQTTSFFSPSTSG